MTKYDITSVMFDLCKLTIVMIRYTINRAALKVMTRVLSLFWTQEKYVSRVAMCQRIAEV